MQPAETWVGCIAKIEVVVAGAHGQQGRRCDMRGGAGTWAAGQVRLHAGCLRGQLHGIGLGVGQGFAAAAGTGAGHHAGQRLIGAAEETQLRQAFGHGMRLFDIGQQHALPGGEPQGAVTIVTGQLCGALEHRRIQAAQGGDGGDIKLIFLRLWISAKVQQGAAGWAFEVVDRQQWQAQTAQQVVHPHMAHAGLLWGREVKERVEDGHYQRVRLVQSHGGQGCVQARTTCQAKREQRLALAHECR